MGESFSSITKVLAPRAVVWAVMSDHVLYARWTPARGVTMERLGAPDPNGVGAIRVFDSGPVKVKEEVVAFDPPTRLVYRLASGLPVRDYRSVMTLEDDGDVTVLSWSSTFTARIPLTGGLFRRIMSRAVDRFAAGIKAEAESRAGGTER